jgi:hypothetical protein
MRSVHIENIGDMAVIECEDRVVRSEAAFKLREAVTRNEMRESLCLISRKCASSMSWRECTTANIPSL